MPVALLRRNFCGVILRSSTVWILTALSILFPGRSAFPINSGLLLKLSCDITHVRRLVKVEEILSPFLDHMSLLGDWEGCVLVQLSPYFQCNTGTFARVESFLKLLPTNEFPFALEFRHVSWI